MSGIRGNYRLRRDSDSALTGASLFSRRRIWCIPRRWLNELALSAEASVSVFSDVIALFLVKD